MIQNLIFKSIFLKIFSMAYTFLYSSFIHTFQQISPEFFLISDCLAESLKASRNYQKRSLNLQHSFAQKTSLILWTSTHLTFKIIYSWNTAKNLSEFTKNFQTTMFLFGVRKNICTPPFLDGQNCILEALWRQMSVYFCFWGSLGESE